MMSKSCKYQTTSIARLKPGASSVPWSQGRGWEQGLGGLLGAELSCCPKTNVLRHLGRGPEVLDMINDCLLSLGSLVTVKKCYQQLGHPFNELNH